MVGDSLPQHSKRSTERCLGGEKNRKSNKNRPPQLLPFQMFCNATIEIALVGPKIAPVNFGLWGEGGITFVKHLERASPKRIKICTLPFMMNFPSPDLKLQEQAS